MERGRVLEVTFNDLYYNLALEEAIFTNLPNTNFSITVRFWQNPMSVNVGRGQDLTKEVDEIYCLLNNIEIGRRISGGGAVYTDSGNLNTSFFVQRSAIPHLKDVEELRGYFTDLIIESLINLGYAGITKEGNSNILYQGKKISGSAGFLKKDWYLHHATLLYDANLTHLDNSLLARNPNPEDKKASRYFPTVNLPLKNLQTFKKTIVKNLEKKLEIKFEQGFLFNSEKVLADKLKTRVYNQTSWIIDKQRD